MHMENIISIKNLSTGYKDKLIFENLSLEIEEGTLTTIIGPSSSGKSTLIKLLTGKMGFNKNVYIGDFCLNQEIVDNNIGIGFELLSDQLATETVLDTILLLLPPNIDKRKAKNEIISYAEQLNIKEKLGQKPQTLNNEERQLMFLIFLFMRKPKIITLDKDNSKLTEYNYNKIFKILKKLQKQEKITVIQVTNNIENALESDKIIVLDKGQIIGQGRTADILERKELFDRIQIERPFVVSLSDKLKFYGIIDKSYLDLEKLVGDIWK